MKRGGERGERLKSNGRRGRGIGSDAAWLVRGRLTVTRDGLEWIWIGVGVVRWVRVLLCDGCGLV